jgi:hypothetical protein
MDFTIEEEAFLLECYSRNGVNRQLIKRLCIASIITFLDNTKVKICMYLCITCSSITKQLWNRC